MRKVYPSWVEYCPSSWDQENCVEKRLCKFEAKGREFVTFSRHFSCLRELEKEVTNIGKNFAHGTNLDNHSYIQNVFLVFPLENFPHVRRNGILLPQLFWPTVRKNCSSDREKLLKFRDWRPRICKIFEITWTIHSNSERSEKFLIT